MKRAVLSLFFFLIIGNLFAEISVKSFRKLENDMTARIDAPKRDQNGDVCAIIKVVTTQTGFGWEPDGLGIVAAEPKLGEYWLYIPYGAKRLTIKHAQLGVLRNYLYPMPIEKATVYEMVLTTGKVITTVEETIESQWLIVNPVPEDAAVYINDEYKQNGVYSAKFKPGKYSYRIEAPLYHTEAGIAEITDSKKTVDVKLKPAFGYLNISTSPEQGAKVLVDGKPLTQSTPVKTEALASGEHTVKVMKDMFAPAVQKVTVTDENTTPVDLTLQPNFAELSVSAPAGAMVYINNTSKGTDNWHGRLGAGVYTVEARMNKHKPAKQDIELVAGDVKTMNLTPIPIYGSLDVISKPLGASIKINGKDYGTTPNTINKLLIGEYNLELSKSGYGKVNMTITIEESKELSVDTALINAKEVRINSNPIGAKLFVNDKFVGVTPYTGYLSYGENNIMLQKDNSEGDNVKYQPEYNEKITVSEKENIFTLNIPVIQRRIYFYSHPSGANLYIDGEFIGTTPVSAYINDGNHPVMLKLNHYKTVNRDIFVNSNRDEVTEYLESKKSNREIGKEYYFDHLLSLAIGVHQSDFLNATYDKNISSGYITGTTGWGINGSINAFPIRLDMKVFQQKYNIQNSTDENSFFHQGIEASLSYYLLNINKYFYLYSGLGFQASELTDKTPGNTLSTNAPFVKVGAQLTIGALCFFGEYNRSFLSANNLNYQQLYFGLGFNLVTK